MSVITHEELGQVKLVMDVVAPYFPPRDYRKELWITTFNTQLSYGEKSAAEFADKAVDLYDKRFPQ